MEWDSSIATMKSLIASRHIAWSPCSRFIVATIDGFNQVTGVESKGGAQILDAVTLERLGSFAPPESRTFPWSPCQLLTFSPERSLLTWVSGSPKGIFSWDVQTGVLVSGIPMEGEPTMFSSITYSQCGTMFGVSLDHDGVTVIGTYNALSGIPIRYHPIQGLIARTIWTHGECLRFATLESGSITVWELEYASEHPVTEVESLPIPDNFYLQRNTSYYLPSPGSHSSLKRPSLCGMLNVPNFSWILRMSRSLKIRPSPLMGASSHIIVV
jgi:hypothetical protein